jgi:hypothetical protein
MRAASRLHEAAQTSAALMGGALGVCMRAAPRVRKAAPTTAKLMGGGTGDCAALEAGGDGPE